MIQEFIVDEQDYFNWVRQHLSLMEEIGMENYLIEQLGEYHHLKEYYRHIAGCPV